MPPFLAKTFAAVCLRTRTRKSERKCVCVSIGWAKDSLEFLCVQFGGLSFTEHFLADQLSINAAISSTIDAFVLSVRHMCECDWFFTGEYRLGGCLSNANWEDTVVVVAASAAAASHRRSPECTWVFLSHSRRRWAKQKLRQQQQRVTL